MAPWEDYKEIRGVGEVKAIQLACVGELSARIWKTAASEKTVVFDAPSKVAAFYMEEMRHLEQENLKLLLLNTKNILLKDTTVSIGTVNASCATPREDLYRGAAVQGLRDHSAPQPSKRGSDAEQGGLPLYRTCHGSRKAHGSPASGPYHYRR